MKNIIDRLGAAQFGAASSNPERDLEVVQEILSIQLPIGLTELLLYIPGAIVFNEGARYRPAELALVEDGEGFQHLEVIYGLADEENGLLNRHQMYAAELPSGVVAIGEAPGGDQICLDRASGKVWYWVHDASSDERDLFLIADSFKEFCARLQPVPDDIDGPAGVIEGESYLDF